MNRYLRFLIGLLTTLYVNVRYKKSGFTCKGILYNCKVQISGNGHKVFIDKGVRLKNVVIEIKGFNNTLIIERDSAINESGRIRIEDSLNIIHIKKRVNIQSFFLSVADTKTSIEIGDDCLLSANIIIRTSDAHSILDSISKVRINPGKSVIISDRVWIGYGVNILKGSTIGHDSVIGTQSLIAGLNVPPNCIAAGMPAKVIKHGITWSKTRI